MSNQQQKQLTQVSKDAENDNTTMVDVESSTTSLNVINPLVEAKNDDKVDENMNGDKKLTMVQRMIRKMPPLGTFSIPENMMSSLTSKTPNIRMGFDRQSYIDEVCSLFLCCFYPDMFFFLCTVGTPVDRNSKNYTTVLSIHFERYRRRTS